MLRHPELTDTDVRTARKTTLRKLRKVSTQIEELLAGQDVTLLDIKLPGEADEDYDKLTRLRQYKKLLNETLDRMGTDDYGYCMVGGEPIPKLQLMEMPWAETCQAHAGRQIIAGKEGQE